MKEVLYYILVPNTVFFNLIPVLIEQEAEIW
ncbi:hypothetical protein Pedsa_2305 [Pseudopedobacter saltans DSM 12145]|uniref:Uncharacterized protein n=1 Tax=Pseudopedobacter saltans (strain ATCC 51119 / DSM 12145 / JCM 21818 / CCUG 39354 / LMG 10337 / NBRC 100064 / NCIMB 13643) TaxID=762903 RepID=F0SD67_PSESL|nr:hypothetical protein Pedsa_2305 [Pseudopedobacter saltans DSM 12145]